MARESYNLSLPATLMLMGEHAVLVGKPALVCSLSKRMFMRLRPRLDQNIYIHSQLGQIKATCQTLQVDTNMTYLTTALVAQKHRLKTGFELEIEMDFSHTIGFGSSAAVSVGICALLGWWQSGRPLSDRALFEAAKKTLQSVQSCASGADLAACILGGVVFFQANPFTMKRLTKTLPVHAAYVGYKVPTSDVIEKVQARKAHNKVLYEQLESLIEQTVLESCVALESDDLKKFGALMNFHQGLQNAIGVSDLNLEKLIDKFRSQPGVWGAKISGAGLGDCVIGLGELEEWIPGQIKITVCENGLIYE